MQKFPPFDLERLLKTVFNPQSGERLCILIDLDQPADIVNLAFLKNKQPSVQKIAYDTFYQALRNGIMQKLHLGACDFFAYKKTGGSNLELPKTAMAPDGSTLDMEKEIYPAYDIILCLTSYSATAPLTATAKKFGFRGATMHGINDIVLQTGLSVDYNEISRKAEGLRQGLTHADSAEIRLEVEGKEYHLHIELGKQDAQKSHGLCRTGPDIANLPAGEVYFVPVSAQGDFPIQFEEGTLGLLHVEHGRVCKATLIQGNPKTIAQYQAKLDSDPATGVLGELGLGTQVLPFSGCDIQDEKIFGTFHLATGRNDHLTGPVTLDRFINPLNATHEDILFSSVTTPKIRVREVSMKYGDKKRMIIENGEPSIFMKELLNQNLLAVKGK